MVPNGDVAARDPAGLMSHEQDGQLEGGGGWFWHFPLWFSQLHSLREPTTTSGRTRTMSGLFGVVIACCVLGCVTVS